MANGGVKEIGDYAFALTKISRVDLPDTVETIEWYAFSNNLALTSVTFPVGIESIKEKAFFNTGLSSVSLWIGW